jgi:hypothetical protein
MRSKELDLSRYHSDKIANRYLEWYDPILQPLVGKEVKLLELGIGEGGSLLLWRDYFPNSTIVGIGQWVPPHLTTAPGIQAFQGKQENVAFLSEVAAKTAPDGFDVIIDDASHLGDLTRISFWHLFDKHLKPGGLYIIEDWGTGYWGDWPDGKRARDQPGVIPILARIWRKMWGWCCKPVLPSHLYGMVGFIKQLIDEQGAADLTQGNGSGQPTRLSKFERMVITPGIVFITKRA